MFDLVVVISLAHRPDRLAGFYDRLPDDLPFPRPELLPAVDGRDVPRPAWWETTDGAWGCLLSHQAAIDRAIRDGADRLLVFEDDATFVPDFSRRLSRLPVPADCQQLYLGGQHLREPVPAADGLVRGRNINRTHAYAILGRSALAEARRHIEADDRWACRHHVDHRYGELHAPGRLTVYAARPWLCGQAAGRSDVSSRNVKARAW
jgi:hypothetical protein